MVKSKNHDDKIQNLEYWISCISNKNDFPEVFFTLLGVRKLTSGCWEALIVSKLKFEKTEFCCFKF